MIKSKANAIWHGGLKDGQGNISSNSGALNGPYSFKTRFEGDEAGTNPEELIGAAHAGCYSMFLSSLLEKAGKPATRIMTEATVHLNVTDNGPLIQLIELITEAEVDNMEDAEFQQYAQEAKEKCPISAALKAVPEMKLTATLRS
jgi:osmotically inducible protein OsmC